MLWELGVLRGPDCRLAICTHASADHGALSRILLLESCRV